MHERDYELCKAGTCCGCNCSVYYRNRTKKSSSVFDKYIPIILGVLGVIICGIYVFATSPLGTPQDAAMAVFTAIVQGILVAGASTYVNQIFKQSNK